MDGRALQRAFLVVVRGNSNGLRPARCRAVWADPARACVHEHLSGDRHALFLKKLEQSDVDGLVAALEKRGSIVLKNGAVSYTF